MKRKISVVIGIFSLSLTLWQALLQAQPISIRLGHVGFPGSLFAITADEYAKRVNTSLQGKVEVKVFHSSQLGSDE
ncbi:MAG: hypothetical protein E6J73_00355 [Deltaproteobacteria bacterium]|nr:MAG: hypothetical protein E6J73_00355 [Deltaproteobacteria bacterium]